MFNFFKKLFDRRKQVEYGDKTGKQQAQPIISEKTGEMELHIKGEKYPLRCHPRHHVLHGNLMISFKRKMKNMIIEQLAQHMEKMVAYKIPEDQWAKPVKEISRVFDLMINAEDEPSMKHLMRQFRDPICMVLQEDDAWRFRTQIALQKLDMNKIKLNESDLYYFRAKSFKVDKMLKNKLDA